MDYLSQQFIEEIGSQLAMVEIISLHLETTGNFVEEDTQDNGRNSTSITIIQSNVDIKVNIVKQKKTYYLPVAGTFASAAAVKSVRQK